jgi:hypothetical protein
MTEQASAPVIVAASPKNVGIAILLTFIFGPVGMFYSTIVGAVIMCVISLLVGIFTLGFGLIFTWPICIIWGAVSAHLHNKALMSGKKQY